MSTREWFAIDDPDEQGRTWSFDVTFLSSSWRCIFGDGCQGIHEVPTEAKMEGCCSHGAYAGDKADRRRVEAAAREVSGDIWQFHDQAGEGVFERVNKGEWRTRLVDDACIFLNRPGFAGPLGCALHHHASVVGVHYSAIKPEVCWQLPLRRNDTVRDDGTILSEVGEFSRLGWGDGGEDFAWWCTEDPNAFTGSTRVYESMREELIALAGPAVYELLREYLDIRIATASVPAHPVEMPVQFLATGAR